MITGGRILVIGAGQIGETVANKLLELKPELVVAHTYTLQEAQEVSSMLSRSVSSSTTLATSWRDLFSPFSLSQVLEESLRDTSENRRVLTNFFYGHLTEEVVQGSTIYQLVKKWQPNVVVDGVNTATVCGYEDDPYTTPRHLIELLGADSSEKTIDLAEKLLLSSFVPKLVRFVQTLYRAMLDFEVERYVKVSTTGLGGMGINIKYTHGDVNEEGMSSGILGKVSAAGVLHQLLWSIAHSPKIDVKIVVPAALVGWEPVRFGKFHSNGSFPKLVDCEVPIDVPFGSSLKSTNGVDLEGYLEIPYVDSGENSAYSLGEMAAITALGQMGSVTREEVADAVIQAIEGSTRHDILAAMDAALLGPSYNAAFQRNVVLKHIADLELAEGAPSIATGNLGPTVAKHLFELHILKAVAGSVENLLETDASSLATKASEFVLGNRQVRRQILSLGLPILLDNGEILLGTYWIVPNSTDNQEVDQAKVDSWARQGWVDLRVSQISSWLGRIKLVGTDIEEKRSSSQVILNRNWQSVVLEGFNVGEILAYVYSMEGGDRKTY